jgi:hypothetical protein
MKARTVAIQAVALGMALAWVARPALAEDQPGAPRSPNLHSVLSNMPTPDHRPLPAAEPLAGTIFGQPVPRANYYFAKRVAYAFPRPWERHLTEEEREQVIWEALILHFESFRRGITVSEEDLQAFIDRVLREHGQSFTARGDAAAYAAWVRDTVGEDVELFEHQMRYYRQIEMLREQMQGSFEVTVTEEEMRQEFLNERHHIGGELAVFETLHEAEAFATRSQAPGAWEAAKQQDPECCRPFSTITLEAVMDLWGVPQAQVYAFHALELGSVGPPMPFGRQWVVLRLLDKRTGDLADFPARREAYREQLTTKKQYEALKRWVEELKASANLQVLLPPNTLPGED